MHRQLHLHPVHGDAAQQGVLLREQSDEGPDRADAAQLRGAARTHLPATGRPPHPAAQDPTGQLLVSSWLPYKMPDQKCQKKSKKQTIS